MDRLPDPMRWLAAGVPLTLLLDLFGETVPDSAAILAAEPATADWLPAHRAA